MWGRCVRAAGGAAVLALLVAALARTLAPASATAADSLAQAGTRYAGRAGSRWYDVISVAKDGRRLSAFDIGFVHGGCSDGEPYDSEFGDVIRHGATIDAAGRASYATVFSPHATFITRRGKTVVGKERIVFTIHFAPGHLHGAARDEFVSARLKCSSGVVTFAGYPEGSPQAPLHDATTGTGTYRGMTNQVEGMSAKVYLPLKWVQSVHISWRAYCRNGYSFGNSTNVYLMPLHGSRFSARGAGVLPADKQGLYEKWRSKLAGKFYATLAIYRLAGTWTWSDGVYRAGRRLGACTTGPVTFTASGPSTG